MKSEYLMVFVSLLGVIGLIFLTYYGAKWLNKKFNFGSFNGNGKGIKIVDITSIAQDKQLLVVTVGKKNLLLGVTPAAVTKICDLDDDDMDLFVLSSSDTEHSFFSSLKLAMADNKFNNSQDVDIDVEEKDGHDSEDDF